jgi:RNA polymerase sigma-70 factor (ECF subfamily)
VQEGENHHSEDYELVQAALKGKEAFARLVSKYQHGVYHTAFQILRNAADAQDAAQEAFIRAYESLEKYNPGFSFLTWVTRIAVNISLNILKTRKRQPLPLETVSNYPAKEADGPDVPQIPKEKILRAVETLRPRHRVAFVLFHIEKKAYGEIASIMDVPLGSVKNYLLRARRRLRKILSSEVNLRTAGSD